MNCRYCNEDVVGGFRKDFCKYSCYENWTKWNKTPNCKCINCGIPFYLKESRIKKCKNGVSCSYECSAKVKSLIYKGEGNHQYGLKGSLNSSFKGAEIFKTNHKNIDIYVYLPEHPYRNECNRVLKHRYIVEQNYQLFDSKFFEKVDGVVVLKKEFDVHHKDGDHNNNDVKNLQPITRSEHTTLHNNEKIILRDSVSGRIVGIEIKNNSI